MNIYDKLQKIKRTFFALQSPIPTDINSFRNDLEEIKTEAIDDYERSYNQYLLREKYGIVKHKWLRKITYMLLGSITYLMLLIKKSVKTKEHNAIVYYQISQNEGILPPNFVTAIIHKKGDGKFLDEKCKVLFRKLKQISHNDWVYLYEVLYALTNYCYIINCYKPKVIVTSFESSCASSVLTLLCNMNGIKNINIMHGEKLFCHLNTLAHFDEFYIWDKYYEKLFKQLKMKVDRYIIYNPWENMILSDYDNQTNICFYLVYVKDNEVLSKYSDIIRKLATLGFSVHVRPHPSQSRTQISAFFDNSIVEDPHDVTIFSSLSKYHYIASTYSTVLFQAYSLGKEIIIDDVIDQGQYNALINLGYIMLNKDHILLSSLLEKNRNNR